MLATQQAQSQLAFQIQTYPCCNWLEYWVWLVCGCVDNSAWCWELLRWCVVVLVGVCHAALDALKGRGSSAS
jgi:hypothetical protein